MIRRRIAVKENEMSRKILTPSAAMEIKRLYELADSRGRPLHSQMEIASILGVSETTVFRVVKRRGAYGELRELPSQGDVQESMAKFAAANPDLMPTQARMEAEIAKVRVVQELPAKIVNELEEAADGKPDAGYA